MSNPVPSTLALSVINDNSLITASAHRNNYAAVQTAVNALIAALSGGSAGQLLQAVDGSDVVWHSLVAADVANAGDKASSSDQVFTGNVVSGASPNAPGGGPGAMLNKAGPIIGSRAGATNIVFATTQPNGTDTQFLWAVDPFGTQTWGTGVLARDTSLGRNAPGQLVVGGTASKGNIVGGASSSSSAGPATLAPDAASMLNRWNLTTPAVTYTIAAPTHPPAAGQSALMAIVLKNGSGGVVTLSWDAAFNATPAGPNNGFALVTLWVWNPGVSKWDALVQVTNATE